MAGAEAQQRWELQRLLNKSKERQAAAQQQLQQASKAGGPGRLGHFDFRESEHQRQLRSVGKLPHHMLERFDHN